MAVAEKLTTISHIEIGFPVFYFDPVREGELRVRQSIVYGAFVHKQEGELYYFLEEQECPAYAVAATEGELNEKIKAFDKYRTQLAEANKANQERFRALRSGYILPEYSAEERNKVHEQKFKEALGE